MINATTDADAPQNIVSALQALLPWSPQIGIIVVAIIAGYFAVINRRGGEKSRMQASWAELEASNRGYREEAIKLPGQLTAMKQELKDEFDRQINALEGKFNRKVNAVSRMFRAVADQAPPGFIPRLDPDDVAELDEDTLPPQWRPGPSEGKEH